MGTILLYGFDELPAVLAVRAAAGPFLAEVLPVHAADYLRPVGALVGRDTAKGPARPYAGGPLGCRMMVLCDLDEQVYPLLDALRQAGVGPEVYKAVLTPHNQSWDALTLLGELKRERETLQGRKK